MALMKPASKVRHPDFQSSDPSPNKWLVGGWPTPLKNMSSSMEIWFPIYGKSFKIPWVPATTNQWLLTIINHHYPILNQCSSHHQPDIDNGKSPFLMGKSTINGDFWHQWFFTGWETKFSDSSWVAKKATHPRMIVRSENVRVLSFRFVYWNHGKCHDSIYNYKLQ